MDKVAATGTATARIAIFGKIARTVKTKTLGDAATRATRMTGSMGETDAEIRANALPTSADTKKASRMASVPLKAVGEIQAFSTTLVFRRTETATVGAIAVNFDELTRKAIDAASTMPMSVFVDTMIGEIGRADSRYRFLYHFV